MVNASYSIFVRNHFAWLRYTCDIPSKHHVPVTAINTEGGKIAADTSISDAELVDRFHYESRHYSRTGCGATFYMDYMLACKIRGLAF